MSDEVVAPGPAVIEQNTSGVVGVLAEALAPIVGVAAANECASVVAALPNIATVMLPESHPPSDLFQDWWTDDGGWTVERHVRSPQIRLTFDEDDAMETSPDGEFYPFTRLTASEAYDLGTALLAAAWAARAAGGQA